VIIVMADSSDDPADIVTYYRAFLKGYDCVFGSRFCRAARITGYPGHKLALNRLGNYFIQMLFFLPYNDVTNAFKCYSRKAIEGMQPLISRHFNLTVEMPLKAIVRGYSWQVVPTNWYGRAKGVSKWNIKEMGSRYLFIILYLWLERFLSRNDYRKGQ
jgi:dolichol-phosphate mannosyltransferase